MSRKSLLTDVTFRKTCFSCLCYFPGDVLIAGFEELAVLKRRTLHTT